MLTIGGRYTGIILIDDTAYAVIAAAWVMCADAVAHYESAGHFVARLTLGDVCGSLSGSASDTSPPSNSEKT